MYRFLKKFAFTGCLLLLLWGAVVKPELSLAVGGASLPELQQKQQQIEQYRLNVNQAKEQIEQREQSARTRLGGLKQQINSTATQIEAQQTKLKTATDQLKVIEKELAIAQANYGKQQRSTIARLRFWQRQTQAQGWSALLQSDSLNELLDRQYQLRRVYAADQTALVTLKETKKTIEAKKLAAETQRNQIALLTQQLMMQKATIENQAQTEQVLVKRLRNDREALTAALQQLELESDKIGQNIQQRLAARIAFPNAVFLPGTGQMLLPAEGPITSGFGWRIHPILGTSRLHNGIDFGADYGSLIRAADNGVVISAEWTGGYGNTVIIDHGNGLTTLYGHASELYVMAGQSVQKGQPVAAVGSTGLSTGPHLHFEVRQAGEPIDPLPFLVASPSAPSASQRGFPMPEQGLPTPQ
jgi:murein DD-endopeptidase MepM/ murein hydrolase activator NlpD